MVAVFDGAKSKKSNDCNQNALPLSYIAEHFIAEAPM
jgi:hypothetical protein